MKVAVLGLGFMGTTHVKAWHRVAGAVLAAVESRDSRKLEGDFAGVAGNLGGASERVDLAGISKYGEIEPLLEDPEIEAVDVCLPTYLHESVAIQALRAGKHVLVEKPMALDEQAAERMIDEAARANRVLMTAHVLRFLPEYTALRDVVHGGTAGSLRHAEFRRRCAAPGWAEWMLDPAKSGGGAFDLLIHDADLCLHLFGPPVKISATGYVDHSVGIDCLAADLFYGDGGVVSIAGGWRQPGSYPFSMEYTVTLEGGTVEYSSAGRTPHWYGRDGSHRALKLDEQDGYVAELAYFAQCCRTRRDPALCPALESAAAVKLMRLVLKSRRESGARMKYDLTL